MLKLAERINVKISPTGFREKPFNVQIITTTLSDAVLVPGNIYSYVRMREDIGVEEEN